VNGSTLVSKVRPSGRCIFPLPSLYASFSRRIYIQFKLESLHSTICLHLCVGFCWGSMPKEFRLDLSELGSSQYMEFISKRNKWEMSFIQRLRGFKPWLISKAK
jgi:hypothetical protein